jgi:nitrogen permease regulator 2-like protein
MPPCTRLNAYSESGSHVLHQVPEDAISSSTETTNSSSPNDQPRSHSQPLFSFPQISSLVIPPQEFCDRLITVCVNKHRVISYPVCVDNPARYERNQFIFNFGLVLEESVEDWSGYASVVRKVAGLFRNLEEQGGWLSMEERRGGVSMSSSQV